MILAACLLALVPSALQEARSEAARVLLEIVQDWSREAFLPEAEDLRALLAEADQTAPDAELARALGALGHRLGQAQRGEEARRLVAWSAERAQQAQDLSTAGWALDWLGQEAWIAGRLDEAAELFGRSAELELRRGSSAGHVQEIANVARIRMTQGRLDEALAAVRAAETRARESGQPAAVRRAAEVRGTFLLELGRHREALDLCLELTPPGTAVVPEDEAQVRLDLLAASALADVGRLETAELYARRAHAGALGSVVQRSAPLLALETRLTLGLLLGDLGAGEEGLALLEEADRGFAEIGDERGRAWTLKNRGFVLFAQGRFEEAGTALAQAEREGRRLEVPWLEGIAALGLAESLVFGDAALEAERVQSIERALAVVDEHARRLGERQFEWRSAAVRGRLSALRGRDEAALVEFERAVQGIEAWRQRLEVPGLVEHALRPRSDPYREAALAAARLGRAGAALHFAGLLHERASEALGVRRGADLGPVPEPELEAVRRRIGRAEFLIRQAGPQAEQARRERTAAEAELGTLLLARDLRRRGSPGAAPEGLESDVESWLASQEADLALVYVVGRDSTLALRLAPGAPPRAQLLALGRARLEALVARLRDPIRSLETGALDLSHLDFDVAAARALHQALVAPLELPDAARLLVVPDQGLATIPFEMLVSGGEPGVVDPACPFAHLETLRFLGDDHVLVTTGRVGSPAAAPRATPGDTLVLVAAPEIGVPRAELEARTVAAALAPGAARVVERATRADLIEGSPRARNLHLVAHGWVDDGAPAHGHLILGGTDQPVDRVEAWQIEALRLDLDRVVLSACHTAEGAWYAGAGLAGLARGFLRAGTREVVASAWAVEDAATLRFMEAFYRALATGETSAQALRTARRSLRHARDPRGFSLAHPYFWAGFVLRR